MSKNGAGYDPAIEDVWPLEEKEEPKKIFVKKFLTYLLGKRALINEDDEME